MAARNRMLWGGAVFILILSIVTFVFIPTTNDASGSTLVFGKWNGKPIEYTQDSFFVRQIQVISEQVEKQGQELNQFMYYQVMQQAFNSAVVRLAVLEEMKKVGYSVPESLVDKALIPYYLDENGKYSSKIFTQTPETTRSARRVTTVEEMTVQRYADDMFGTRAGVFGLKTGTKEIEIIKTMSSPERSFSYASFSTGAYPEAEAVAFGKANSGLFVMHDLSLITVDTEAVAKKVSDSLAKKTISFDDAVTTYSTRSGTDATGKLGKNLRYNLNELFADAKDLETVLALKATDISPIVKTGKTFAIVRCNALPVEADFANPVVIGSVTEYMTVHEKGKIEDYFIAKAKEFAANARAVGFDKACADAGLAKKSTTAFGINYGNVNILAPVPVEANPELASAVKSENFFKTAFSLGSDAVSEPVLVGNSVIVLKVNEEKAADTQLNEMLPIFYNYYANSWSQNSFVSAVMKSDKLENHFTDVYLKYFLN